jgi:hypothetical protein
MRTLDRRNKDSNQAKTRIDQEETFEDANEKQLPSTSFIARNTMLLEMLAIVEAMYSRILSSTSLRLPKFQRSMSPFKEGENVVWKTLYQ